MREHKIEEYDEFTPYNLKSVISRINYTVQLQIAGGKELRFIKRDIRWEFIRQMRMELQTLKGWKKFSTGHASFNFYISNVDIEFDLKFRIISIGFKKEHTISEQSRNNWIGRFLKSNLFDLQASDLQKVINEFEFTYDDEDDDLKIRNEQVLSKHLSKLNVADVNLDKISKISFA